MGIQINGQTDTISATDGSFTISGASGDLIGNLTGNVTGNLTGTASTASNLAAGATLTIGAGSTSAPSLAPSGDSNTGVFFPSADTIAFAEGGAEAARIDSSGRFLVGTPTSTAATAAVFRGNSLGSGQQGIIHIESDNTNPGIGNIGRITFADAAGSRGAEINGVATGAWSAGNNPTALIFSTTATAGPVERMRLNNIGALKVRANGTTSTTNDSSESHELTTDRSGFEALYVTNRNSTNPFGIQVYHPNSDTNNASSYFFQCYGSSTLRAGFRTNGGLANYSANNANLCDEREKKNIETLDSTWGCLKNWEVKKFHYNEDADTDDKRYGVIAQQVAPHCPEVITDWVKQRSKDAVLDDDGNVVTPAQEEIVRMGVKEQQMMWMAIKALQEAQTRIETLEAEVAALKAQ